MKPCSVCASAVEPLVSFGRMPLANAFLRREEFENEYHFDLAFGVCERCGMAQLLDRPPPGRMFHAQYPFFTATSARMVQHFHEWAREVRRRFLRPAGSFVVEIGSNDGSFLEPFAQAGIRHLGVEPSANVAAAAAAKGVRTMCRFFNEETAREIVSEHGQADVVLAANCFCHIPDLHGLAAALDILLKPQGRALFEDPYVGDILEKVAADQIYDEHAYYFSVGSVDSCLSPHGFEILDVEPQAVHGGSIRFTAGRRGTGNPAPGVASQRRREALAGLQSRDPYRRFGLKLERLREDLLRLLNRLKKEGKRVLGYGATSKSTTILNYCGISADLIEFIVDSTPAKQGRFSPGMHIPIRATEDFGTPYPDYALLFAWNHAAEILHKEAAFSERGGEWLVYVPRVGVLERGSGSRAGWNGASHVAS